MKKLPWRAAIYLAVLGWFVLDLKVCHGPLREAMRSQRDAAVVEARARGWVALVNQEPLTREQVDLAVERHLFQRGKTVEEIPEKNLAMIRRAVLQTLIDDTLVRQYADGEKFAAPPEETAAFVAAWKSGFASSGDLAERAATQGLDPAALDVELARIWSRKRWLERRVAPGVAVTEEEAKGWFEANRAEEDGTLRPGFFEPAKVRARQIVFASGDEAAARERHAGGAEPADDFTDLGWIASEGLPEEFAGPVFAASGPGLLEPFRTRLGWHLVEVLEMEAERPLAYEEIRGEIVAHLEAVRTEETVKLLMGKLRKVANLHLFPENL